MNNYILNLLNIEDKNIHILPNINEKIVKGIKYKIIEGFLIRGMTVPDIFLFLLGKCHQLLEKRRHRICVHVYMLSH